MTRRAYAYLPFDQVKLPDKIMATWYAMEVTTYSTLYLRGAAFMYQTFGRIDK